MAMYIILCKDNFSTESNMRTEVYIVLHSTLYKRLVVDCYDIVFYFKTLSSFVHLTKSPSSHV